MDIDTARRALAEAGFAIESESRLKGGYGSQIRLENGAVVNVYDKGTRYVQGKNAEPVRAALESHEAGGSRNGRAQPDSGIVLYTDGACSGNPGPGGYGAVLRYGKSRKELSGGFRKTTNNRMELLAVIEGLEALREPREVTIFSDSKYIVDAVNKGWARRWRANDWRRNKREKAENSDLWARLMTLLDTHKTKFRWVKGHAGNPGNERADRLAVAAARGKRLAIDEGYEYPPPDTLI